MDQGGKVCKGPYKYEIIISRIPIDNNLWILKYANGDVFEGEFKDDKKNGCGTVIPYHS